MLEHEHPHDPASGRLDWKPDFQPTRLPQTLLLGLIRLYKVLLSPHLPPACRFYPTCSDYGFEAIRKYGALKGGVMAVRRLLRCHPLHPGGYDPVP